MTGPGEVMPEPDGDGVWLQYRRRYGVPVEELWAALTEPDRLAGWIGTWTGEPVVGGTVDFVMVADGETEPEPITIAECAPPHRLVVEWPVPDHARWRVEVTLEGHGGESELLFVHRLSEPEALGDVGPGWQYYLDRLDAALTGGTMPAWADYYPALRETYEQA
jgi:uncharacterized protein YndB with AHSA1/START domain